MPLSLQHYFNNYLFFYLSIYIYIQQYTTDIYLTKIIPPSYLHIPPPKHPGTSAAAGKPGSSPGTSSVQAPPGRPSPPEKGPTSPDKPFCVFPQSRETIPPLLPPPSLRYPFAIPLLSLRYPFAVLPPRQETSKGETNIFHNSYKKVNGIFVCLEKYTYICIEIM